MEKTEEKKNMAEEKAREERKKYDL